MDILTSLYGLTLICMVLALIAVAVFLRSMAQRLRWNPQTGQRLRTGGKFRDAALFLVAVVFFLGGMVFLNLGLFLQSYRIYAVGEPVALVSVYRSESDEGFTFQIEHLSQALSTDAPESQRFYLKGDTWQLQGHIVRFKPWLSFMGLEPVYQFARVQGDYLSFEEAQAKERVMYPMIDKRAENWWKWVYEHGESVPLVDMVSGSSVSKDAKDGDRFIISVLPTGFTLDRAEDLPSEEIYSDTQMNDNDTEAGSVEQIRYDSLRKNRSNAIEYELIDINWFPGEDKGVYPFLDQKEMELIPISSTLKGESGSQE